MYVCGLTMGRFPFELTTVRNNDCSLGSWLCLFFEGCQPERFWLYYLYFISPTTYMYIIIPQEGCKLNKSPGLLIFAILSIPGLNRACHCVKIPNPRINTILLWFSTEPSTAACVTAFQPTCMALSHWYVFYSSLLYSWHTIWSYVPSSMYQPTPLASDRLHYLYGFNCVSKLEVYTECHSCVRVRTVYIII